MLAAFPDHVVRRAHTASERVVLVHGRRAVVAKDTLAHRVPWVVATAIYELGHFHGEVDVRFSEVSPIHPEWLAQLFPQQVETFRRVDFDHGRRRVRGVEGQRFRDLPITEQRSGASTDEEAAAILAVMVFDGTLTLRAWNAVVEQWVERVNLVAQSCPELGIPPIDPSARREILRRICRGARAYQDIKDRAVCPWVIGWLPPFQTEEAQRLAPDRAVRANGRKPRILYETGRPPTIALPILQLYGVTETPRILGGRMPVTIQILAPHGRPVQITADLPSFGRDVYPQVKRQLQRRYPRHEWR